MKEIRLSRRALLLRACQVPAASLLLSAAGCADKRLSAICADPNAQSDSDNSLRASLQYVDQAPDAANACSGCAYFHATAANSQCGRCDILNGAVSASGHCTSWSHRA